MGKRLKYVVASHVFFIHFGGFKITTFVYWTIEVKFMTKKERQKKERKKEGEKKERERGERKIDL